MFAKYFGKSIENDNWNVKSCEYLVRYLMADYITWAMDLSRSSLISITIFIVHFRASLIGPHEIQLFISHRNLGLHGNCFAQIRLFYFPQNAWEEPKFRCDSISHIWFIISSYIFSRSLWITMQKKFFNYILWNWCWCWLYFIPLMAFLQSFIPIDDAI